MKKGPITLSRLWGLKLFQKSETVKDLFYHYRFENSFNSAVLLPPFLSVIGSYRFVFAITNGSQAGRFNAEVVDQVLTDAVGASF
jgi:hypothetical protein